MKNELSFWAINIYSIIRGILDTAWGPIFRAELDKRKSPQHRNMIITDPIYRRIFEEAKKEAKDICYQLSFQSIFSNRRENIIFDSINKYRNFCFESVLSTYLCQTIPGRKYSFDILKELSERHNEGLLKNVLQIYVSVAGNENSTGYKIYRYWGGKCMVLGGLNGVLWKDHPLRGEHRASTLDLSFIIEYKNHDSKPIVILGEVEGNKGNKLLTKKYWEEEKPKCALFGIGTDVLDNMEVCLKETIFCKNKEVPVLIFPNTTSKIFHERTSLSIFEIMDSDDFLGYAYHVSYTEFIRFLQNVQPKKEYTTADPNLTYIFNKISKDLWDAPFLFLLREIESEFINIANTQEIVISSNRNYRKHIHDITSSQEKQMLIGREMSNTELPEDPFSRIFQ